MRHPYLFGVPGSTFRTPLPARYKLGAVRFPTSREVPQTLEDKRPHKKHQYGDQPQHIPAFVHKGEDGFKYPRHASVLYNLRLSAVLSLCMLGNNARGLLVEDVNNPLGSTVDDGVQKHRRNRNQKTQDRGDQSA